MTLTTWQKRFTGNVSERPRAAESGNLAWLWFAITVAPARKDQRKALGARLRRRSRALAFESVRPGTCLPGYFNPSRTTTDLGATR